MSVPCGAQFWTLRRSCLDTLATLPDQATSPYANSVDLFVNPGGPPVPGQAAGQGQLCVPCTWRQRAYRLRRRQAQQAILVDLATATLCRQRQLVAQTVYQCPACEERYLGEGRCSECNLMCRKLGLGGRCSGCDEILTVGDLIGFEPNGGDVVA